MNNFLKNASSFGTAEQDFDFFRTCFEAFLSFSYDVSFWNAQRFGAISLWRAATLILLVHNFWCEYNFSREPEGSAIERPKPSQRLP